MMKTLLLLLVSALSIQAASIEIPNTPYRFEYDAKTWDFLPKSTETDGVWAFSDHLLFLGGALFCLDSGTSDGLVAKEMAESMADDYDKVEEGPPISGLKTLKFTSSEKKTVQWLCYLPEAKYTLFLFVKGDRLQMTMRASTVRAFLSGIKKRS